MKKRRLFLLLLILIFAFFLRIPQLNFPSIGYHNMKENEYISMAKNMQETGDLISREVYFYHAFDKNGIKRESFDLYPQVPFVAYQILLGYKLFGEQLWFPRLVNIVFILLAIIVFYRLTTKLTGNFIYGLFAAALMSFLPLGVYISRNIQPESGAFFFAISGTFLFFKFLDNFSRKYLFFVGVCFAFAAAYKLVFLVALLPLFLIFPYKRYLCQKTHPERVRDFIVLSAPFFFLFAWWVVNEQFVFSSLSGRVNLLTLFTPAYWRKYGRIIWHYAKNENFTLIFFIFFVGGVFLSWAKYIKDKTFLEKYLRANSISVAIYFLFFSDYLNQHYYYQLPFLAFVILAIIYFIREISIYLDYFLKTSARSRISILIFVISLFISFVPIKNAISSHFNVIFPGGDTMGEILRKATNAEERFFIYTHAQGYAPCVYAQRKCGWPESLQDFKDKEEKFKVRYLVIHPASFLNKMQKDINDYVHNNYHINTIGFIPYDSGLIPAIILLEKSQRLDMDAFLKKNKGKLKLHTVYRTMGRELPFYIMSE